MSAPNVTILWDDQSAINSMTMGTEDTVDRPIFMVVSTFDKGPEEWTKKVYGSQFEKLYGKSPSFKKHGQPAIQCANIINSGGYATIKRVVAEDSRLANIGVVAEVSYTTTPYIDPNTNMYLYESSIGGVVNRVYAVTSPGSGYTQVNVNQVNVNFKLVSLPVAGNNIDDFKKVMLNTYKSTKAVGNADQYPLFMLFDTGRGLSNKRFRIYRDTSQSYPISYARYFLEITEDDETLETLAFTVSPYVIEHSTLLNTDININLQNTVKTKSNQLRAVFFDDEYDKMCENIAYLLNVSTSSFTTTTPFRDSISAEEFALSDVLFGTDLYGEAYDYLTITTDLDNVFGIPLKNGSDGTFANYTTLSDCPKYTTWVKQAFDASWNNKTADDIYDVDNNRLDVVFDANYPPAVKNAIETFVTFREDLMYFRDFGTECNSVAEFKAYITNNNILSSRFCASYCNYYDIYDPFTRKQITVTVTYNLAALFVTHFINGRARPFCGIKYGVVLPTDDIIEGTLNFYPKITPKEDQKASMDTLRINYCNYYDGGILAMNSCYTSQTAYTQLSWLHNVLGIQQIIKAIRVVCPKIRYTFTDGDDLVNYKKDIQENVISKFSSNFKSISIDYVEDDLYDSNKIIYAVLTVQFRNFVQSEIFKITAIQS